MRFFSALAVVLAALIVSAVSAADPVNVEITAVEEQPGRLVVTVGAYDAEARPLTDLTAASFRASLDGRSLPISDVQTSKAPRSAAFVVLVVDTSGSMAGEPMNQAKRALQEFVRGLDPVDQAAIIAFDAQVTLVQDFTSDRALLDQAIGRLAPLGDTALYSGVLEALAKASAAPGSRRLIVLLSDGQATTGLALRSDSIDAARNDGIGIVAVGLGSGIDGAYLNELTAASGGRFLEAPTPASLREAYADLAVAIRSQYTLVLQVPSGIDRSVPAELLVQASLRADSGKAVREIPPLAGALPPPFLVSLLGITAGQRTEERLSVTPKTPPGVSLVGVEYFLDNDLVVRTTQPPFAYELDPTAIAVGSAHFKGRRYRCARPARRDPALIYRGAGRAGVRARPARAADAPGHGRRRGRPGRHNLRLLPASPLAVEKRRRQPRPSLGRAYGRAFAAGGGLAAAAAAAAPRRRPLLRACHCHG